MPIIIEESGRSGRPSRKHTYFTHAEILTLADALANSNAKFRIVCTAWPCGDIVEGHPRDWSGTCRYEIFARFPAGMSATACVELSEIARKHGCEATLWDCGGDSGGMFQIHPQGKEIHLDVRR